MFILRIEILKITAGIITIGATVALMRFTDLSFRMKVMLECIVVTGFIVSMHEAFIALFQTIQTILHIYSESTWLRSVIPAEYMAIIIAALGVIAVFGCVLLVGYVLVAILTDLNAMARTRGRKRIYLALQVILVMIAALIFWGLSMSLH